MNKHTREELKLYQSLPLEVKIRMSEERIRGWVKTFGEDGVYISFSGGKDSTVLMDIIRNRMHYDIPAVFSDTGLEYPEIREFVKTFDNVTWIKPKMNFKEIINKYGYPLVSKEVSFAVDGSRRFLNNKEKYKNKKPLPVQNPNDEYKPYALLRLQGKIGTAGSKGYSMFNCEKWEFLLDSPFPISSKCCDKMKKEPFKNYFKETGRYPITAQMASESRLRYKNWLQHGCNMFTANKPMSNPLSFWTEQDVLEYIKKYNVKICSVYGDIIEDNECLKCTGLDRTGCMFCGYGCHQDEPGRGRFELMKKTHPKVYDYIMRPAEEGGLDYKNVIDWLNEHGNLNIKY